MSLYFIYIVFLCLALPVWDFMCKVVHYLFASFSLQSWSLYFSNPCVLSSVIFFAYLCISMEALLNLWCFCLIVIKVFKSCLSLLTLMSYVFVCGIVLIRQYLTI